MACACNKNKTNAGLAARAEQKSKSTPTSEAKTSSTTQRTASARPMRGAQQSFALQAGDRTASYGSRLERDAAQARIPGSRPA